MSDEENLEEKITRTTQNIVFALQKGRSALVQKDMEKYKIYKSEFQTYTNTYLQLTGEPYIVRKKDYQTC